MSSDASSSIACFTSQNLAETDPQQQLQLQLEASAIMTTPYYPTSPIHVDVPCTLSTTVDDSHLAALLCATRGAVRTNASTLHRLCCDFEQLAGQVAASEARTQQRLDHVVERVGRAVERAGRALDDTQRLAATCVSRDEFDAMNRRWEKRLKRLEAATGEILPAVVSSDVGENDKDEVDQTSKAAPGGSASLGSSSRTAQTPASDAFSSSSPPRAAAAAAAPLGPLGRFVRDKIAAQTRVPMQELYERITSEWDGALAALADDTIADAAAIRSAGRIAERDTLRGLEEVQRTALDCAQAVHAETIQGLAVAAAALVRQQQEGLAEFGFTLRREAASQLHHTRGQHQAMVRAVGRLRNTLCLPADDELAQSQKAPLHTAATDFLVTSRPTSSQKQLSDQQQQQQARQQLVHTPSDLVSTSSSSFSVHQENSMMMLPALLQRQQSQEHQQQSQQNEASTTLQSNCQQSARDVKTTAGTTRAEHSAASATTSATTSNKPAKAKLGEYRPEERRRLKQKRRERRNRKSTKEHGVEDAGAAAEEEDDDDVDDDLSSTSSSEGDTQMDPICRSVLMPAGGFAPFSPTAPSSPSKLQQQQQQQQQLQHHQQAQIRSTDSLGSTLSAKMATTHGEDFFAQSSSPQRQQQQQQQLGSYNGASSNRNSAAAAKSPALYRSATPAATTTTTGGASFHSAAAAAIAAHTVDRRTSLAEELLQADFATSDVHAILDTPIFAALRDMLLETAKSEIDAQNAIRETQHVTEIEDLRQQLLKKVSMETVQRLIERSKDYKAIELLEQVSATVKELQGTVIRASEWKSILLSKADFSMVDGVRVDTSDRCRRLEEDVQRLERAVVIGFGEQLQVAPRNAFAQMEVQRLQDEQERERLYLERGNKEDSELMAAALQGRLEPSSSSTSPRHCGGRGGGEGGGEGEATTSTADDGTHNNETTTATGPPFRPPRGTAEDARSVVVANPRQYLQSAPASRNYQQQQQQQLLPQSNNNNNSQQPQQQRVSSAGKSGSRYFSMNNHSNPRSDQKLPHQHKSASPAVSEDGGETSIIYSAYAPAAAAAAGGTVTTNTAMTTASSHASTATSISLRTQVAQHQPHQQQQQARPPRQQERNAGALIYTGIPPSVAAAPAPTAIPRPTSAPRPVFSSVPGPGTFVIGSNSVRPQRPGTASAAINVAAPGAGGVPNSDFASALRVRCNLTETQVKNW